MAHTTSTAYPRPPPHPEFMEMLRRIHHSHIPQVDITTLTQEEILSLGYILIPSLGWVHRSRKPSEGLIENWKIVEASRPRPLALLWARRFFGSDLVLLDDFPKKKTILQRIGSFFGKVWQLFSSVPITADEIGQDVLKMEELYRADSEEQLQQQQ